jgi:hypothetical protein
VRCPTRGVLAAGPVGSLALFAAYSLGMRLVLTAVALGAALFYRNGGGG